MVKFLDFRKEVNTLLLNYPFIFYNAMSAASIKRKFTILPKMSAIEVVGYFLGRLIRLKFYSARPGYNLYNLT